MRLAMNPDWRTRYDLAVNLAQEAGRIALGHFNSALEVELKQDASPVTLADRQAEALLRSKLLAAFPKDGFLGEESGTQAGSTGFRWIIDPIDGTRNFVRGIPLWATLVGLEHKGEQVAGIAYVPTLGLLYRALRGDGAYCGDRRIRVSDIDALGNSLMFYSSLSWFIKAGRKDAFENLSQLVQRQRGFGDFYGFVLVAQGSGEIMVEYGVHPWDVAAIQVIVEEAGGRFSNWDGARDITRPDVLVTNGKLHNMVLDILGWERPTVNAPPCL
jgi:histidinol-phosphatase